MAAQLCDNCGETRADVSAREDSQPPLCLPCWRAALAHGHVHVGHDDADGNRVKLADCPTCAGLSCFIVSGYVEGEIRGQWAVLAKDASAAQDRAMARFDDGAQPFDAFVVDADTDELGLDTECNLTEQTRCAVCKGPVDDGESFADVCEACRYEARLTGTWACFDSPSCRDLGCLDCERAYGPKR